CTSTTISSARVTRVRPRSSEQCGGLFSDHLRPVSRHRRWISDTMTPDYCVKATSRVAVPPVKVGSLHSQRLKVSQSHLHRGGDASDLSLAVDSISNAADRLIDVHAIILVSIAVPERHRTGVHVRVAGNQHERHFLRLRITNLFLHAFIGIVDLDADPIGAQTSRERP